MSYPKRYPGSAAPPEVVDLVCRLVPALIDGDHSALAALRAQFKHASIREVELTGHGFYVDFDIPADSPLTEPASFAGGNADIVLEGASARAGCVLFVREGRLATLEGYTFGDEGWPDHALVLSVENIQSVHPATRRI